MKDVKTQIMDAAERRMQRGGFGGFSFREIAADVGIKSSSVHYHFPTKESLAAAVIRRWAADTSDYIDNQLKKDPDPIRVWTNAFRGTAVSRGRMCPCTVLGAASQDLPAEVATEVKVGIDEFAHHVFRAKGTPLTADELGDFCERIGPTHGIQRRIVDAADNAAQLIVFAHV